MSRNTKFVQWYSYEEWNEVYKKVYSNDVQLMEDAYRKMCIWNARSPNLPAGVENTMELLQVILCDRKSNSRSYSEKDLALMYSSAILRFLNHVKSVHRKSKENKTASLYDMAMDYGLPDWMVNVRHEASHQCSLPSIHLLRSAHAIAFDWLKNNYWTQVADQMKDMVVKDSKPLENLEMKVKTLLTLWQAIQIQIMLKRSYIQDIPNGNLRNHLTFLLERNDVCTTNGPVELNQLLLTLDECREKNTVKVTKAKKVLREIIQSLLPKERSNSEKTESTFINMLIQSELFIPKDYDTSLFVEGETLNNAISSLWTDILIAYHEADLTTDIIHALVAIVNKAAESSQRLIASCWLSHLCSSLLNIGQNSTKVMKVKPRKIERIFAMNILENDILKDKTKEYLFSDDLNPLKLSAKHNLRNDILENSVNESVFNANPYSRIYLQSLIDLLNPPLTNSAKEDLLKVINIYTDMSKENLHNESAEIFTVESFNQMQSNFGEESTMEVDGEGIKEFRGWTKNHGIGGWSKCALGCLPNVG